MGSDLLRTFSAADGLGSDAQGVPPILIARAGLDNPWLNGTIDRFVQIALDVGASLDLMNHPTGHHSFHILDNDLDIRAFFADMITSGLVGYEKPHARMFESAGRCAIPGAPIW